jgi:hypothetical protein
LINTARNLLAQAGPLEGRKDRGGMDPREFPMSRGEKNRKQRVKNNFGRKSQS